MNYTYLVIGRGARPTADLDEGYMFSSAGRLGGVGREAMEKEAIKMEGKGELREVEGGEFEMVSLSKPKLDLEKQAVGVDEPVLMGQAYGWPRVVAPPMKRAGHVILDTCYPDGQSHSLTHIHPCRR